MKPMDRSAQGSSTMLSPVRQLAAIILTLSAVLFAFFGLQNLIVTGPWLTLGLAFLILIATCTFLSRLLLGVVTQREPHLLASILPTCVGGALSLWLLAARFGSETTTSDPAISWGSFVRLRDLILSAQEVTAENSAPIEAYEPIALIAIGGAILVFLLADLLGNAVRVPALVGITVLPLWLPQLIIVPDVGILMPLGTCVSLLALMALDNPFQSPLRNSTLLRKRFAAAPQQWMALHTPQFFRFAAAISLIIIGAVLVGWVAPHLPVWKQVTAPSALQQGSGLRIADSLDLSESLFNRSNEIAFTYRWDGPQEDLGPLRTATLTDYRKGVWAVSELTGDPIPIESDTKLWPFSNDLAEPTSSIDITMEGFRDTTLPLPNDPRTLKTKTPAQYDLGQDTVRLDAPTTQGQRFTLESYSRDLTAEDLRSPGADTLLKLPEGYARKVLPPAFELPASQHMDQIIDLAGEITADSSTSYDKVLRLQEYFREEGAFTYSLEVPNAKTQDPIWDFLTDRTGYCVQFSSAMTIMARSLGLPARVGVGFLPGEETSENEYTVRGRDAHAWTEIFFDNVGWVRFDPTPAVQSGAAPLWAPDSATSSPDPVPSSPEPTLTPSPSASSKGGETSVSPSESGSSTGTDSPLTAADTVNSPVLVLLGAGLALILLILVAFIVLRRRQKVRDGVEGAWHQIVDHGVRLGTSIDSAATVRQVADRLEPSSHLEPWLGFSGAGEPAGPIHELAVLVEQERYSKDKAQPPVSQDGLDVLVKTARADLTARFSDRLHDADPSAPRGDA